MEKYELTQNDYEDIGILMNITYSLLDNFIKLRDIEAKDEKDTPDFFSTIECLQSTLSLEESIYQRFNSQNKLQLVLNYFVNPENSWDLKKELSIAASIKVDDLIKQRIILKLLAMSSQYIKGEKTKSLFFVSEKVKEDFINTILTILNLYLNSSKFKSIKDGLMNLKYNLAFIYEFVEKDFLANEFSINPELYWYGKSVAEIKQVDNKYVDYYKHTYATEVVPAFIDNLVTTDLDVFNKENFINVIISQIFVRAGFLFSERNTAETIKEKLLLFVSTTKLLNVEAKNTQLVTETVDYIEQDKSLPRIVSFKMEF